MKRVYVLGLDYQLKDTVDWTVAVTHVLRGTMTIFKAHETDRVRSAGGVDMPMPEIVRLNYWVNITRNRKVDLKARASRMQILERDGFTCAYCGDRATTVDHILPESRAHEKNLPYKGWTWGNLVAACSTCNAFKDNKTPEEANMKLLWQPYNHFAEVQETVWSILENGGGHLEEDISKFEGTLAL